MPTNEERREVAMELRRTARDTLNGYSFQRAVEGIAFGTIGDRTWRQTLTRLADLIEPELERTCRNTTRHRYYGFECSECKWSAYEPNDYGNDVRFDDFNYCPNCGAKVVD